jgi:hypothetical protein
MLSLAKSRIVDHELSVCEKSSSRWRGSAHMLRFYAKQTVPAKYGGKHCILNIK